MIQDHKDCSSSLVAEFDTNLLDALDGAVDNEERLKEFNETMDSFLDSLHEECIGALFGHQIDAALELAFGVEPSPGFICGTKEAIVERNHSMLGRCCLDAPHELEGDAWGHPVSVDMVACDVFWCFANSSSSCFSMTV